MFITVFSLTKPQSGIKKQKIISEGIDILISLDISRSMLSKDFLQQTRIDGAKKILVKFIQKRKGDRIGLVTFGESSFVKCPTTLYTNRLIPIIKNIQIDQDSKLTSRTAIGIGLASAINRLLKIKDNKKSNSKIIILVTDGINNTGEISPATATEIAVKTGIKVYTIGIGRSDEVDLELLKNISNRTNGFHFHAKTSGELGQIFEEINKNEKHEIESFEYKKIDSVGYQTALVGIILLICGLLLNSIFFKRIA
jgi:Ca-activated chloride channel family protein